MIRTNEMTRMAPDDGTNPPIPNNVLDTLPQDDDPGIGGWDEVELEDAGSVNVPPELAGKTQAELIEEINRRDAAAAAMAVKVDPTQALANQFAQFLQLQTPKAGPLPEGYRVKQPNMPLNPADIEAFKKKINEQYLDDPSAATEVVMDRRFTPVLVQLAESQAQMSRALVRLDPDTKDIYAKYASEIESDVAEIDASTKLRNPNVYRDAVERAKARHYQELVAESTTAQQEAIAAKYLESLGLNLADLKAKGATPAKPIAAASSTLATSGRVTPATPTVKSKITVTPAQRAQVESFARARGVSISDAASFLRAKGAI